MSTDFSIKPVGAPVAAPIVTPASVAADNAIATELPPAQSVTAASASANVRNDPGPTGAYVSHQAFLDQAAAAIVYQVVDNKTGRVLQQFPDEAILRRRAYFHTLDLTKSVPTGLLATDRRA
jgi:hypothetical protein